MRIAWFRDTPADAADPFDATASTIGELRAMHRVDVVTEADAHDFVWRHALYAWDLCVYEVDNTPSAHFVWAYLLNYPGVVMLKSSLVQTGWGRALSREGRLHDYLASFRFKPRAQARPILQVPLFASRIVVVPNATLASDLRDANPTAHVRFAPIGVPAVLSVSPSRDGQLLRVLVAGNRHDVVQRAAARARAAGAAIEVVTGGPAAHLVQDCDVVVSLTWPPFDAPLTSALAGMAAGKPVVAFEMDATGDWPALDPQTWQPRDSLSGEASIAVTIDPRDEEHSLTLTLRRLAEDREMRDALGRAAKAWWALHATPRHALSAWDQILAEAVTIAPPPRPLDWPTHLGADGTERTRGILREFGLTSDLF